MTNQPILIGIIAGIAAGLLTVLGASVGIIAIVLMFGAIGAIYIATMGWGRNAAIASVLTATGLIGALGSFPVAVATTMLMFAPAALVGYLFNFGHRQPDGNVSWFPFGQILFRLMMLLTAAFLIVGFMAGIDEQVLTTAIAEMLEQLAKARPDLARLTPETISVQAQSFAKIMLLAMPGLWLFIQIGAAALSARITRSIGLLPRPNEDIAGTLVLPVEALGFILAGLVGVVFMGGIGTTIGSVLLGIGICGYAVVGLAVMHYRLRGNGAAPLIFGLVYGSIILFSFPIIIFTIMGIFRTFNMANPQPPAQT